MTFNGDTFWVYARCDCGVEMAMREGATWPDCPLCGALIRPPRPNLDGKTPAERRNGRQGLCSPIYDEGEAMRLAGRFSKAERFRRTWLPRVRRAS